MASQDDVRRICLRLPGVTEDGEGDFRFRVDGNGIAWVWLERREAKKARVPNPAVVAVWVGSEGEKDALIDLDPQAFFSEAHYDGYPAILVRLDVVDAALLERLLTDAWRMRAPKRLQAVGPPVAGS